MHSHFLFSEDRSLIDRSSEEAGGLSVRLGHAEASLAPPPGYWKLNRRSISDVLVVRKGTKICG